MIEKNHINDLVFFGGKNPYFKEKLYVGKPNIGNRKDFLDRINDILDSRRFSNNGKYVQDLENRIIEKLGVKNCIVMSNGTIALEIAIRALEMKGEVIIPSMTFIATAHALQWQGIRPIFCDINIDSLNIDPDILENKITLKTTGIIGVHLFGRPCDVDKINKIAQKNKLKIIYDAAHAFNCSIGNRSIGCFGDAEVFSFHATKFFNTFEGGAIVTNDNELAKKIRLLINFGFSDYDTVISIGINGKMNEVSAAMGLTSLDCIEDFIKKNKENYAIYERELKKIKGIKLLKYDEKNTNNYQYIVILIDDKLTGIIRDYIHDILWMENVLVRRYFYPGCHKMEPYKSLYAKNISQLTITDKILSQILCLPTGSCIEEIDIIKICKIIKFIIENSQEINTKFIEKN
jgi:dTDP-4-amino-4,6-dideoxygalactose transaminase